jgi:hypothetical protein
MAQPSSDFHSGNFQKKIFQRNGIFFMPKKRAPENHQIALNHHAKTTNLPSKITTSSDYSLQKASKISKKLPPPMP